MTENLTHNDEWKPKTDNTNWYLKLEKCHICKKGFTQEDVNKWAERIVTVQTGPTRWAHSNCYRKVNNGQTSGNV